MLLSKFQILRAVVPEKSLTKNFIGEKEKWTNKGTDKHEDADTGNDQHEDADSDYTILQVIPNI